MEAACSWLIVSGDTGCRRCGRRGRDDARAYGLQPRRDTPLQQKGQAHTTERCSHRGSDDLRSHRFIGFMSARANLRVARQRRPGHRGLFFRRWR